MIVEVRFGEAFLSWLLVVVGVVEGEQKGEEEKGVEEAARRGMSGAGARYSTVIACLSE